MLWNESGCLCSPFHEMIGKSNASSLRLFVGTGVDSSDDLLWDPFQPPRPKRLGGVLRCSLCDLGDLGFQLGSYDYRNGLCGMDGERSEEVEAPWLWLALCGDLSSWYVLRPSDVSIPSPSHLGSTCKIRFGGSVVGLNACVCSSSCRKSR